VPTLRQLWEAICAAESVSQDQRSNLSKCGLLFIYVMALMFAGDADDRQRFDGWYNNRANPSWGSTG